MVLVSDERGKKDGLTQRWGGQTVSTYGQAKTKSKNNRKWHASDSDKSSDKDSSDSSESSDEPAQPKWKPRNRKKAAIEEHEDTHQ